jgi:hypothetical protein
VVCIDTVMERIPGIKNGRVDRRTAAVSSLLRNFLGQLRLVVILNDEGCGGIVYIRGGDGIGNEGQFHTTALGGVSFTCMWWDGTTHRWTTNASTVNVTIALQRILLWK